MSKTYNDSVRLTRFQNWSFDVVSNMKSPFNRKQGKNKRRSVLECVHCIYYDCTHLLDFIFLLCEEGGA